MEQVLPYDVAEAEAAHGRPSVDEVDKHIQMGMFAIHHTAADSAMAAPSPPQGISRDR